MSQFTGLIRPEHLELFALELKKIAIFHFVFLQSRNKETNE